MNVCVDDRESAEMKKMIEMWSRRVVVAALVPQTLRPSQAARMCHCVSVLFGQEEAACGEKWSWSGGVLTAGSECLWEDDAVDGN